MIPRNRGIFLFERSASGHDARICPVFFVCGVYYTNCTNSRRKYKTAPRAFLRHSRRYGAKRRERIPAEPLTAENLAKPDISAYMEYHTRSALKRERTERKPRENRSRAPIKTMPKPCQNHAKTMHKTDTKRPQKRAFLSFAVMYKKGAMVDIC